MDEYLTEYANITDKELLEEIEESQHFINEFYGLEDNTVLDESVINDLKEKYDIYKDLKKQWQQIKDSFVEGEWIHHFLTNKMDEEKAHAWYNTISKDGVKYAEYKRAFQNICKFMGLNPKETDIEAVEFDTYQKMPRMNVRYSKGFAKIKIPAGVQLLHVSPAENITALNPSFRSKLQKKYFYPENRVYFTLGKEINAKNAGLEKMTVHRYTTTKKYTEAYIDPVCQSFSLRSVYIPTDNPIPVQNYEKSKMFNFKEFSIEGMEIYDYVDEVSILKAKDRDMLKDWNVRNEAKKTKSEFETTITDDEYMHLKEVFKTLSSAEEYGEYKKAFNELCKFCHIVPEGVVIAKHELTKTKEDDKNKIYVSYAYNNKPVKIPEGMSLYHDSPIAGLTELKPTFKGKAWKGILYSSPRVYFTLKRSMTKKWTDNKAEDKLHKYTPRTMPSKLFIDPLLWSRIQLAVYAETTKPIPVVEVKMNILKPDEIVDHKMEAKSESSKFFEESSLPVTATKVFGNKDQKMKLSDLEDEYDRKYNAFCLSISSYSEEKLKNTLEKKQKELEEVEKSIKESDRSGRLPLYVKADYLKNVISKCKSKLKKIK